MSFTPSLPSRRVMGRWCRRPKLLGAVALMAGLVGLVAAGSPTGCSSSGGVENVCGTAATCQTKLTLLHTGDVHSRLFPYTLEIDQSDATLGLGANESVVNVGGMARMSYILGRERARSDRVLHLNAGDFFEGAPIFNYFLGEPEIRSASAVGLDAMVIGNHEFDKGPLDVAIQLQKWADFPVLAANYQFNDPNLPNSTLIGTILKPFTVFNQGGLKIAVIGMGNLSSLGSVFSQPNSLGILPLQTEQTAQFYVDLLRPYVDVIVMLSHLGLNEDETMVQGTTGIDVVMGGHNHIVVDPPQVLPDCSADPNNPGYIWEVDPNVPENPNTLPPDDPTHPDPVNHPYQFQRACKPRNVLIMQSGAFSKYVGRIDLILSNDPAEATPTGNPKDYDPNNGFEVISSNYQIFPITDSVPDDPAMDDLLQPYQTSLDVQADLDILAGFAPNDVKRIASGGGDSPLGNLVATSMWLQLGVQTDFAITNSTGIRTDLNPGPVAITDLFNVFPFDNTTTTMELSGTEVRELFDFVARSTAARSCASTVQIAGARIQLDCSTCDPNLRPDTGGPCNSDSDCTSGATGACDKPDPTKEGTCAITPCAEAIYIGQVTEAGVTCNSDADCAVPGSSFTCLTEAHECVESCNSDSDCCPETPDQPQNPTGCKYPMVNGKASGKCCPGQCFIANPAQPGICQLPVSTENDYQLATNNYIATGGSGFRVLQRNTTQVNTQILQRDSLIDYMREGNACGYSTTYANDVNLAPCSTDDDCANASLAGFVCACPSHVTPSTTGATTTCATSGSCDLSQGRCVRGDCRDDVATFHNQLCVGAQDLVACQNDLNACSIAGEECKTLACVDSTEGALTDNRVTVVR
jgi:5'-nucleotidase/UDP-sugar diphosphatase